MDYEKLRSDLIVHIKNYICSACGDVNERISKIKSASDSELIKMAEKLHFNISNYKI